MLPIAIAPLSKRLKGHDLVIVIGAPIFRYYPYIAGDYLPEGAELLQITSDPADAGAAAVGDSLLADAKLALQAFIDLVPKNSARPLPTPLHIETTLPSPPSSPLTAIEVFAALSELRPKDAILVQETASNSADLLQCWPTLEPDSYFTFASGGWVGILPQRWELPWLKRRVAAVALLSRSSATEPFNTQFRAYTRQRN
jgi:benzoylformate decarboxylase